MMLRFVYVTWFAEILEKEEEDFEQLAKNLENASPLEIMDKALEKFGNDIAIAFRLIILSMLLNDFLLYRICVLFVLGFPDHVEFGLPLFSFDQFWKIDHFYQVKF